LKIAARCDVTAGENLQELKIARSMFALQALAGSVRAQRGVKSHSPTQVAVWFGLLGKHAWE
jgi:hypothetical protein